MEPTIHLLASGKAFAFAVFPMVGSILLAYGIYQVITDSKTNHKKKLSDRLRGVQSGKKDFSSSSILKRENTDDGFLAGTIAALSFTPKIQGMLDQACVPWTATKLLVNQACLAIAVFFGVIIFNGHPMVGAVGSIAVMLLPLAWLNWLRTRRLKRLTTQLPDVFEIMGQALRAGHSLASAFEVVHDQLPDPCGSEFGRVFHEQNLGIKMEDALLSMADRVDSLDVRFFVTAVLIQRQTGGDLAEILDKIGSVIRERIELYGMVQALTAEGRLSGWVLFLLPTVVFGAVVVLNPNYADEMIGNSAGKIMLMIAFGMQLMGMAMIRWIVNIKV